MPKKVKRRRKKSVVVKRYPGLLGVSAAAEYVGINPESLRRWDREGKFKPCKRTRAGFRLYQTKSLDKLKRSFAVNYEF